MSPFVCNFLFKIIGNINTVSPVAQFVASSVGSFENGKCKCSNFLGQVTDCFKKCKKNVSFVAVIISG